jgi:hypothetical protein
MIIGDKAPGKTDIMILVKVITGPGMTDLQEHHLEGPQEDLLPHMLTLALPVKDPPKEGLDHHIILPTLALPVKDPPEGGLVHHLVVGEAHLIHPIQGLGLDLLEAEDTIPPHLVEILNGNTGVRLLASKITDTVLVKNIT